MQIESDGLRKAEKWFPVENVLLKALGSYHLTGRENFDGIFGFPWHHALVQPENI